MFHTTPSEVTSAEEWRREHVDSFTLQWEREEVSEEVCACEKAGKGQSFLVDNCAGYADGSPMWTLILVTEFKIMYSRSCMFLFSPALQLVDLHSDRVC